ncbi:MAG: hypothetical protein Q4D62_02100 [Planctomycetia bacterium]|nr:hypothetical protein [Planctomycetia bacterium]
MNIEQEIWGLLRSLDSERRAAVLDVLGEMVQMEEKGVERKIGEEGGKGNV